MTRADRLEKLWKRLSLLIARRARHLAEHQSTAATEREMVKVRAEILRIEVRNEKSAA